MKNGLLEGNVVKFRKSDGMLDGGTIVSFQVIDNVKYAYLNTLDGRRVRIKEEDLIIIKHQRKGMATDKFKKRIAKEIDAINAVTKKSPTENPSPSAPITKEDESVKNRIKQLEELNASLLATNQQLSEENNSLKEQLKNAVPANYKEENLAKTIVAMKKSILSGLMFPTDTTQALIPLLDIITELNGINHEPLV